MTGCQMALLVAFRSAFRTQGLFTSLLLAACLLVGSTASVSGQEVMTNETVIQMVKAGFSENVILAKMRSSQTKFDTRTEALIALKQAASKREGKSRCALDALRKATSKAIWHPVMEEITDAAVM